MQKNKAIWIVPLCFFILAAALNFTGKICCESLARVVKPALLPLLSLTTISWLFTHEAKPSKIIALLIAAQLAGCAGDTFLLGNTFLMTAGGILSFITGHVCYITIFGSRSFPGLKKWVWPVAAVSIAALVACLLLLLGASGVMAGAMAVYGTVLLTLVFATLCGLIRFPKQCGVWIPLFLGAVIFTASDILVATEILHIPPFPLRGFVVMFTYLGAQSLLAIGTIRLLKC